MSVTMALGILLGTAAAGALVWLHVSMARRRRRRRILDAPFPASWEETLIRDVRFYHRLPAGLRGRLQDLIKLFMAEKAFEGCSGLQLTEEMKVTIAAQACVLVLNHDGGLYPKLTTVLVYPRTYFSQGNYSSSEHVVEDGVDHIGESWHDGMVVLAWNHVRRGARERDYGQNVTFHEFAHQLDDENGASDGTPLLNGGYNEWAKILSRELQALRDKIDDDRRDILDDYAATNPAEFFAVSTEAFFESPHELNDEHPELYAQLRRYYQLDPVEWLEPDEAPPVVSQPQKPSAVEVV